MRVPRENGEFHLKGDDEMVNDAEVADEMKFEELCASGDCSSMPAKQKMQIKVNICVIYTKSLKLVHHLIVKLTFFYNISPIVIQMEIFFDLVCNNFVKRETNKFLDVLGFIKT